jgi:hypothetical protein
MIEAHENPGFLQPKGCAPFRLRAAFRLLKRTWRFEALVISGGLTGLISTAPSLHPGQLTRDYPVKPVPFTAVHCDDIFWAPRIETNRLVTIPLA